MVQISTSTSSGLIGEAAFWSDLARSYEELVDPFTSLYARRALGLLGLSLNGLRVIDVAAGTGALSVPAAEAGAHVLAVDIAPGMVQILAARLAIFPNCTAKVMDGQRLDSPDGAFDVTASTFGVAAFTDWRCGLSEMARVTREGGTGCVTVWRDLLAGPMLFFAEALRAAFPDRDVPSPSAGMRVLGTPSFLVSEMNVVGFEGVQVHSVEEVWEGPNVDRFAAEADRLYSFTPAYTGLVDADRERLKAELSRIAARFAVRGVVRVPSVALVAFGRRS